MPAQPSHDNLDEAIHQRVRLAIMSTLAGVEQLEFGQLKELLSLTDGNLATHARVLEEAGYLTVEKRFKGRKPQTVYSLSSKGRAAFKRYVEFLEEVLKGAT